MSKQQLYLGEAIVSNGEQGPFYLDGPHAMLITGVLGGATVSLYHKHPPKSGDAPTVAAAQDPEMTFTSLPAPFQYNFSGALPIYFSVSGATGTTSINIVAARIDN